MPFFSPDGRSVGFWAGNQLKTIRLDTAASPVVICAAGSFLGGTWAADGTIIFGSSNGLQRVGSDGGVPRPVTTANHLKSQVKDHRPLILPGGRALLISVRDGEAAFRIDVLTLATGARRPSLLADPMLNIRRPATSYMPPAMPCLSSHSTLIDSRLPARP